MGTHGTFIFRGFDPYFEGLKPSFSWLSGSKGVGFLTFQPLDFDVAQKKRSRPAPRNVQLRKVAMPRL